MAEGGTRPVSSQPALQEVTVGPIVQSSLPHAAETQKHSFEESTPTSTFSCIHFQPCSNLPLTLDTRHFYRWIHRPGLQVVCFLQESASPYPILSLPSPWAVCPLCPYSQGLKEESSYPNVTGTGILIYFDSLVGLPKHRQEKRE